MPYLITKIQEKEWRGWSWVWLCKANRRCTYVCS